MKRKVAPSKPTRRRCAIYTRKSTTHGLDKEFSSLDAQWDACATYVRGQNDWELVEERYDDGGFTGANLERPAFQRLMTDVESGRIDVVVVYKIDRLSRSLLDFANLMERFRKAGAYFVSVSQPFLSADSDAMAQLLLNVLMAFAQFERQMIAERIRDKVIASRRKGLWTGGSVPFGYLVESRKLIPHPSEASIVRSMVELYERWGSDAVVVKELAARNVVTRKGRPWTPQSVSRVLSNPVYAGYVTLGSELNEGEHEPLIERERFQQLQLQRRLTSGPGSQREHAQQQRNPEYLLRGLLFCACGNERGEICGYSLTPSSTRKGTRSYRYYRCIARDKIAPGACPSRPLAAQAIEDLVRQQVASVARQFTKGGQEARDTFDETMKHSTGKQTAELKQKRTELRQRLADLEAELRKLDELASERREGHAARRWQQASTQRDRCRADLHAVETRLNKLERLVLNGSWIAEQLQNFERVWDHLLPLNRLRVIRAVIARVDVNEPTGDVAVTLQPWLSETLKREGDAAASLT